MFFSLSHVRFWDLHESHLRVKLHPAARSNVVQQGPIEVGMLCSIVLGSSSQLPPFGKLGKLTQLWKKSLCFNGKTHYSMAMFNSYVKLQRVVSGS